MIMGMWIANLSFFAAGSEVSGMRNECWHVLNGVLVVMFEASWPALETTSTFR